MALIKRLGVYGGITPNIENGRHYILGKQAFIDLLNANYLIRTFENDNYRINTEVARINGIVEGATYVIDYEYDSITNVISHFRCYFVDNIDIQSNYTILKLSLDLWGTYISEAHAKNTIVKRCNRNIGVGVYDEVEYTNGGTDVTYIKPSERAWLDDTGQYGFDKYISVLFVAEFNVREQVFGDDHISITKMFFATLQELRDVAHSDYQSEAGVTIASDILGGIHAVDGNIGTLDARVIKAWVLPNVLFGYGETNVTFKTKSLYTGGSDKNLQVWEVYPKRDSLVFNQIPLDLNKATYFGCYNYGLKMKRYTTENLNAVIVANIGVIDLSIIVKQGEDQKDITQAFEIPLTTNSSVTTTLRQIAKAFTLSVGAERNLVKDFSQGGPAQAGLGFANSIAGMVNLTPRIDKAIGGGDGANTFYSKHTITSGGETKHCSLNPFVVSSFDSVRDEEAHARYYGATFNEHLTDDLLINQLNELLTNNYELLGVGDLSDTLIACESCITHIPLEASKYIKDKLANGIYYA